MHRRPHMTLKVGNSDHTIGYERQGEGWSVYHLQDGTQPLRAVWFPTAVEAHRAWFMMVGDLIQSVAGEAHVAPEPLLASTVKDLTSEDDWNA